MKSFYQTTITLLIASTLVACSQSSDVQQVTPLSNGVVQYFNKKYYLNKPIVVTIEGGKAASHNVNEKMIFDPFVTIIKNGETLTKSLINSNAFFASRAEISMSYHAGLLKIDILPRSPQLKSAFSAMINKNWLSGEIYTSVNTFGYAHLINAKVTVRIVR